MTTKPTLVLGGTGKTGRRVVERLAARGIPVRVGSRSGEPPFDWDDGDVGARAGRRGVRVRLALSGRVPGAAETVGSFTDLAVKSGARRLVLLSGRGEEEAERAEQAVRDAGAELTILRFDLVRAELQRELLARGDSAARSRCPAGEVPEPFVDAGDIADVAVAALTDDRHVGQVYELTGPRL